MTQRELELIEALIDAKIDRSKYVDYGSQVMAGLRIKEIKESLIADKE